MVDIKDNPPALTPGVARPSDIAGAWYVVHTKPRVEKTLAWELLKKDVSFYLPLVRRTRVWGGRRRAVLTPLFPSYVFFAGSPADRLSVLQTNRACQILPVPHPGVFASELDAIHAALEADLELDVYPHVAVGRRVRVARGPMQGVEGVVVEDRNVARIVLSVSIIGRGASLQISATDLEESV